MEQLEPKPPTLLARAADVMRQHPEQTRKYLISAGWTADKLRAELDSGENFRERLISEAFECAIERREREVGPRLFRDLSTADATAKIHPSLQKFVETYDRDQAILFGPTGCGKSLAAALVLRARRRKMLSHERHGECLLDEVYDPSSGDFFVSAQQLAESLKRTRLGETPELVHRACHARLLIIDDVCWAAKDDATLEVLASRYDECRPTILTVGATQEELAGRFGDAAVRRMAECGGKPGIVVDCFRKAAK